jgi:sugar phosphate isomerase/epimerase
MILGFHTVSLLLHDEFTTTTELAAMGYQCVAVRPRLGGLDPNHERFSEEVMRFAQHVRNCGLRIVIDTEGEFIHDPRVLRGPALASQDRDEASAAQQAIQNWIDVADDSSCDLITFSSGAAGPSRGQETVLEGLAERINELAKQAKNVKLALRPAAGDVIATVAQFERFKHWLGDTTQVGVAADVGEMLVGGEFPVGDRLARILDDLACVYLCEPGMNRSHDRRVGHGDVDLSRVVDALESHGYRGPAIVRVQGHSEMGLAIASEALQFLSKRTP